MIRFTPVARLYTPNLPCSCLQARTLVWLPSCTTFKIWPPSSIYLRLILPCEVLNRVRSGHSRVQCTGHAVCPFMNQSAPQPSHVTHSPCAHPSAPNDLPVVYVSCDTTPTTHTHTHTHTHTLKSSCSSVLYVSSRNTCVCVCVCVCVACVCLGFARARVCVCVRVRGVCVYVCVCVAKRQVEQDECFHTGGKGAGERVCEHTQTHTHTHTKTACCSVHLLVTHAHNLSSLASITNTNRHTHHTHTHTLRARCVALLPTLASSCNSSRLPSPQEQDFIKISRASL